MDWTKYKRREPVIYFLVLETDGATPSAMLFCRDGQSANKSLPLSRYLLLSLISSAPQIARLHHLTFGVHVGCAFTAAHDGLRGHGTGQRKRTQAFVI